MAGENPMPKDEAVRLVRHKKRGTTYQVIGMAELQMNCDLLVDGSSMVVYRGEDGKLWVREESEFEDGRFEALAHPTPKEPVSTDDVERACKAFAEASGYYIPFHRGLSSPSADKLRAGMTAAIAALAGPATQTGDVGLAEKALREIAEEELPDDELIALPIGHQCCIAIARGTLTALSSEQPEGGLS